MYPLARLIGHRGLAAHAPENTVAGMLAAHRRGFRWVEFDIRAAADGVAVLSHDASLRRCGGGGARVKQKTAAQLAKIPVPCGFAGFADAAVPALADVFLLLRKLNMGAVAEMKPDPNNETAAARAVADVLRFAPPKMIVSSFSMEILAAAKRAMPNIPRALNCSRPGADILARLRRAGAANLHCGANAGRRVMRAVAGAGFGVYCFTVDDAATARELFAAGAHGVFTNTGLPELGDGAG